MGINKSLHKKVTVSKFSSVKEQNIWDMVPFMKNTSHCGCISFPSPFPSLPIISSFSYLITGFHLWFYSFILVPGIELRSWHLQGRQQNHSAKSPAPLMILISPNQNFFCHIFLCTSSHDQNQNNRRQLLITMRHSQFLTIHFLLHVGK